MCSGSADTKAKVTVLQEVYLPVDRVYTHGVEVVDATGATGAEAAAMLYESVKDVLQEKLGEKLLSGALVEDRYLVNAHSLAGSVVNFLSGVSSQSGQVLATVCQAVERMRSRATNSRRPGELCRFRMCETARGPTVGRTDGRRRGRRAVDNDGDDDGNLRKGLVDAEVFVFALGVMTKQATNPYLATRQATNADPAMRGVSSVLQLSTIEDVDRAVAAGGRVVFRAEFTPNMGLLEIPKKNGKDVLVEHAAMTLDRDTRKGILLVAATGSNVLQSIEITEPASCQRININARMARRMYGWFPGARGAPLWVSIVQEIASPSVEDKPPLRIYATALDPRPVASPLPLSTVEEVDWAVAAGGRVVFRAEFGATKKTKFPIRAKNGRDDVMRHAGMCHGGRRGEQEEGALAVVVTTASGSDERRSIGLKAVSAQGEGVLLVVPGAVVQTVYGWYSGLEGTSLIVSLVQEANWLPNAPLRMHGVKKIDTSET